MQITAYIVVVLLWLPPLISALYNLVWDLRFWQSKDYRLERVYHNLRWDFEPTHRGRLVTLLKIILFVLIALFVVDLTNPITPLAMLLAFSLWVNEAYDIITHTARKRLPLLVYNRRNALIIFLALLGVILIIVILSILTLSSDPNTGYTFGDILPRVDQTGTIFIPAIYIYLIFSSLLAFVFDLSSPIITTLLVFITSPLAHFYNSWQVNKASLKLLSYPNLIVIAISGSRGKSTLKSLLSEVLSLNYTVTMTPEVQTNLSSLANVILREVTPETQVFIVEMNAYKLGEIAKMTDLIKPHLAVITSIEENHIGLFGSVEKLQAAQSELVNGLRDNGTVILNADDHLIMDIAQRSNGREIFYSTQKPSHTRLENNVLEMDFYYSTSDKAVSQNDWGIVVHNQTHELELNLPKGAQKIVHSILATIATCVEVGIPLADVIIRLENSPLPKLSDLEEITGDNQTTLLVDLSPSSINKVKQNLQQLNSLGANRRILVMHGLTELGKYKHETYVTLLKQIRKSVDVLVTYDPSLLRLAHHDNIDMQIIAARSATDMEYKLRKLMQPKDAILVLGEFGSQFIYNLASEQ